VVRLDSPAGDQGVGPVGQRLRRHELELPDLVPAEPERDGIVPLDEERRPAAELAAQAREIVDGGGGNREGEPRQVGKPRQRSPVDAHQKR
jgi:hypothetical protein